MVRGVLQYVDFLVLLGLGLLFLPFYAVIAIGAWWIDGRSALALWELPFMVAFFWLAESLLVLVAKWTDESRRRSLAKPATVGYLGGSVIAWGLASGFDLRATAIGLLVGLLYTAAQATAA